MALPDASVTILDGRLGIAGDSGGRRQVKLGTSSAGVVNTLYAFSDISTLKATLGQGPLVEAAAAVLADAGGEVLCMKVTGSVAGAVGSITATKTGTATLAAAGASYDAYDLAISIIAGGATLIAGTATFKYSLDGGKTYSAEIAVPTSGVYAIPDTNITLTWTYSSGTGFVAGDSWTAACTAPGYTTTDLANAVTPLLADPRTWFLLHAVGPAADLAGARGVFAALATHMATAAGAYRFARALMEAPEGTDAALVAVTTGLGDLADSRVAVGGGYAYTYSPISGRYYRRNVAWKAAARASKVPASQDIGAVEDGPVPGVLSLVRDERATPSLDAARFVTMRTHVGRQGFYFTRGRMFASAGSDYAYLTNARVMDIGAGAARDAALQFLLAKLKTNANGTIQDKQAKAVEGVIERRVRDALGDNIVSVSVEVDRTVNLLSTGTMKVRIRLRPYGYPSTIELELGFQSPAEAA